ncbi:MAG: hypothetical protein Q9195_002558 [Heterodermia aff. obscurata]
MAAAVVQEEITAATNKLGTNKGFTESGALHLRGEDANPRILTHAQCESYDKNGYLVLPDVMSVEEASRLLDKSHRVMKQISSGGEGVKRHDMSTVGAKRPSPVGRILATFEPGDTGISNHFERRIARLGCGVHRLPTFYALTCSAFHRSIVESLGYGDARITQSQIIAKLAGIGGQIVPHQDGCVSFTNPPSGLTFWYALEDATLENGCLYVAPGSHLTTPLTQRLVAGDDGIPVFKDLPEPLWAKEAQNSGDETRNLPYEYQALEVTKGSLVLFHGNLMHKSAANKSGKDRVAYTFSIIEGGLEVPKDLYMNPTDGGFESL